jgi:hypothetical protein
MATTYELASEFQSTFTNLDDFITRKGDVMLGIKQEAPSEYLEFKTLQYLIVDDLLGDELSGKAWKKEFDEHYARFNKTAGVLWAMNSVEDELIETAFSDRHVCFKTDRDRAKVKTYLKKKLDLVNRIIAKDILNKLDPNCPTGIDHPRYVREHLIYAFVKIMSVPPTGKLAVTKRYTFHRLRDAYLQKFLPVAN